jgi:predicted nucleic acid-binding protein
MISDILFVDTNVFVRYLTGDDEGKADDVAKLLRKAAKGSVRLITTDIVIAELVWVLSSFYEQPVSVIADLVRAILNTEGLKIDGSERIESAVEIFEESQIDFIDAYIIGYMRLKSVAALCSYDKKHLSQFPDIKRVEP